MFGTYPNLSRLFIFIFFPVTVYLAHEYFNVKSSVPEYHDKMVIPGLNSPVTVSYDQQGTPSLIGESDLDLFYAQGYLHASERLWQMEVQKRFVKGQSSTIFGEESLSVDVFMRVLDLQSAAKKSWDSIDKNTQSALVAYSEGVNHWLQNSTALPLEFRLIGLTPKPWTPTDSLAWQKAFALNLASNMSTELQRFSVGKALSKRQMKTFFPYDFIHDDVDSMIVGQGSKVRSATELLGVEAELASIWHVGLPFAGSNSWVASGKHTQSSLPILSNDSHLGVQRNSLWYAMQMKGGSLSVSGMSMVGLPGILLGRNDHIAWGATNLMSDQQDLFSLNIDNRNDNKDAYLLDGISNAIATTKESIEIRSPGFHFLASPVKPVHVKVRKTDIGPIVSDAFGPDNTVMVLRWAALDNEDTSFESFYRLQYAENWQEFRSALSLLKAPGLNFLYADTAGNIGSQAAGKIPVRGRGKGLFPVELSSERDLWRGYVPFEKMPFKLNPSSGFLVSANNEIKADGFSISHEWASSARKDRIQQLLNERVTRGSDLTIKDMQYIQTDVIDLDAKRLLPHLLASDLHAKILASASEKTRFIVAESLQQLLQWNADFSVESIGASIYTAWINELKVAIFKDDFDRGWSRTSHSVLIDGMIEELTDEKMRSALEQEFWCKKLTLQMSKCEDELVESFHSAVKILVDKTGSRDVLDWKWGELHFVEYSHRLMSRNRLVEALFTTQASSAGSLNTISMANIIDEPDGRYRQTLGVGFRQVFEMTSNDDNNRAYALPTGQSGHLLSPHYQDQLEDFRSGKLYYFEPFLNAAGDELCEAECLVEQSR